MTAKDQHRESLEHKYGELSGAPYVRRACSCGFRGIWLHDPDKVQPCARRVPDGTTVRSA